MGFKPDLDDQLVSFSALTLLVWSWPVKIIPEMTYNVLSGTLNPTHSLTHSLIHWLNFTELVVCVVDRIQEQNTRGSDGSSETASDCQESTTSVHISRLTVPPPSARQHPSYGDCLEVKREYYQNSSVLDCVTQCSQSAAPLYEQFLTGPTDWVCHTGTLMLCIEAAA